MLCASTCCGRSDFREVPVDTCLAGTRVFRTAKGHSLTHHGEKMVKGRSACGQLIKFHFQVLNVSCPLVSTGELHEKGTAAYLIICVAGIVTWTIAPLMKEVLDAAAQAADTDFLDEAPVAVPAREAHGRERLACTYTPAISVMVFAC
eukprot:2357253-Amphidinium_carterae.3